MRLLLLGVLGLAEARRRQLSQEDLHYGHAEFNKRYGTRAPVLFEGEDHFHRRLFEHETSIPEGRVQSYLVSLSDGVHPDREKRAELEQRAQGARPHL